MHRPFHAPFMALMVLFSAITLPGSATAQEKEFSVITLGTGAPAPIMDRFGPAVLVKVGEQRFLFDAGRGATQRLWQTRTAIGSIEAHFLTHLHSDHVVGMADLWLTGWLDSPYGRRKAPMRIFGPHGTGQLMDGLQQAYAWDIKTRIADQNLDPEAAKTVVTEIEEGQVYNSGGITITAFKVDHGPLIQPCFGYRIDYDGRAVVISGDTRYSENVIKHARGADLLIHSVAMIKDELLQKSEWYRSILAHHTPPKDAGKVFATTRPKLAALIHFVLLGDQGIAAPSVGDIMTGVRETYDGPLVATEDLMRFDVRPSEVAVVRPTK